jgi:hypothetical protein
MQSLKQQRPGLWLHMKPTNTGVSPTGIYVLGGTRRKLLGRYVKKGRTTFSSVGFAHASFGKVHIVVSGSNGIEIVVLERLFIL